MDVPPKRIPIKHRKISLVGDDAETEETLCIMQFTEKVELPPREAIKLAKQFIREMKENITELERSILWATDRDKFVTYWEDKKNGSN